MDEYRFLQKLTRARSLDLLGSVRLGRLVFTSQSAPVIRPVNHLVEGDTLIVRATAGAAITAAVGRTGATVAYEADSIDEATQLGWSVIVAGTARLLGDELAAARYRLRLRPWVSGSADDVITITMDTVTGYAMVAGEPAAGPPAAGAPAAAERTSWASAAGARRG